MSFLRAGKGGGGTVDTIDYKSVTWTHGSTLTLSNLTKKPRAVVVNAFVNLSGGIALSYVAFREKEYTSYLDSRGYHGEDDSTKPVIFNDSSVVFDYTFSGTSDISCGVLIYYD